MTRLAVSLAFGTVFLLLPRLALSDSDLKAGTYILDGARFEQGCYDPCECPILVRDDLEGSLVLGPPDIVDGFLDFPVTDVSWRVKGLNGFTVHGAGTYRVSLGLNTQHEMVLDLAIDDGPAERYSSGLVLTAKGFSKIDIAVAKNGFYCYDTAFYIVAAPSERPMSWGVLKTLFAGS
jgi:hypothetical protein